MITAPVCDLPALAAMVPDGAKVAVPSDNCDVAMTATLELVRRGVRGLHLVCVPASGLQADIMIGAGLIDAIETSAVTLGELGSAPRFVAALRTGAIRILDGTCPAIHAALQAGQKGILHTLAGLLGTDALAHRPDWKIIDNPFQADDPVVQSWPFGPIALSSRTAGRPLRNVFIGRWREPLTMARCRRRLQSHRGDHR